MLIFIKLTKDLVPNYRKMYTFASQLKAGKGLTISASVIQGDVGDRYGEIVAAKQKLMSILDEEKVKGFVDISVCKDVSQGISHL